MKTNLSVEDIICPIIRFVVSCVFVVGTNLMVVLAYRHPKVPWWGVLWCLLAYGLSLLLVAIPIGEIFWKYYHLNIGRGFPLDNSSRR